MTDQATRTTLPNCPAWCDGVRWHDPDLLGEPTVEHGASVTGGFLPEVRRIPDVVTRRYAGSWEVTVTRCNHKMERDVAGWAEDPVVELTYSRQGEPSVTIPLLPGEALQLARALTRGADLL